MFTALEIAARNLVQAKRRTFLLGLAIVMVAMLFLILRSVSSSVSERMIEAATTLSAGHVNVGGFFKARKKGSDPILLNREEIRAFVAKNVPEAVSIIDRHRGWGRIIGPESSFNAGMGGLVPEEEGLFFASLRLAAESEYKKDGTDVVRGDFKNLKEPNTVLLFAAQAKKLGVGVGDTITVVTEASGGQSNTADLRVVAIASDIGFLSNWTLFVPRETILQLYRMEPSSTGSVMIYLPAPEQSTAVMERLRQAFKDAGYEVMAHDPQPFWMKFDKVMGEDWLGQRLDLTIWSDEVSMVLWVTTALDLVSFFIVGVLALIIMGGITNAMWMSVRERTKEIGTIRAIGAYRSFVANLFVLEAALLGALGATIGAGLGTLLILAINALNLPITNDGVRLFLMANNLHFNLHPVQIFITIALFAVLTGFAALYPALKAARLRPVEALMQTK